MAKKRVILFGARLSVLAQNFAVNFTARVSGLVSGLPVRKRIRELLSFSQFAGRKHRAFINLYEVLTAFFPGSGILRRDVLLLEQKFAGPAFLSFTGGFGNVNVDVLIMSNSWMRLPQD